MGNKVSKSAFIVIIYVILFVFCFGLFYGKFSPLFHHESSNENSGTKTSVKWKELFPYVEKVPQLQQEKEGSNDYSLVSYYTLKMHTASLIGKYWVQDIYKYKELSLLGSYIKNKLTDPAVGNSKKQLKNGYWASVGQTPTDKDIIDKAVNCYGSLGNYLATKDIGFVFFHTPTKVCKYDSQLPDGIKSLDNENIDTYLAALLKSGVECVDFREEIKKDNLDHYSLFYKTDHHWNADAGMWAANVIGQKLNSILSLDFKGLSEFGDYSKMVFEGAMFGSEGQDVSHYLAVSEDFDMWIPNFDTSFQLEIPDKSVDLTGSFEDLFIDYKGLEDDIKSGGGYAYGRILYNNRPYIKITNLKNENGPKVLVIRDSYTSILAPYLSIMCSELVLIDTREDNGNFNGSVVTCIEEFAPDAVIAIQCSPQSFKLNK